MSRPLSPHWAMTVPMKCPLVVGAGGAVAARAAGDAAAAAIAARPRRTERRVADIVVPLHDCWDARQIMAQIGPMARWAAAAPTKD